MGRDEPNHSATLAAGAFIALVVALGAGIGYERVGRLQDHQRLPQIGRSVDIGGRTLNILCTGDGAPAVILESNGPFPGYGWVQVAARVAKLTRVCWYDRAGYGWSDPGPAPRDSAAIAQDLHALLAGAGVPPPYVLVGAGSGGFYVRVFRGLFRREVAGMVLVDADHEDELKRMPWAKGPVPDFLKPAQSIFVQVAGEIGLSRLIENRSARRGSRPEEFTPQEWATISALGHQSKRFPALAKENAVYNRSAEEARAAGGLGALPLIVLASRGFERFPDRERVRLELQQQLARLSTRGKLVEVLRFQFNLEYTALDDVVAAVQAVLAGS